MKQPLYCSDTALEFFLKSVSAVSMFMLLKSKYALGFVTLFWKPALAVSQHPGETPVINF